MFGFRISPQLLAQIDKAREKLRANGEDIPKEEQCTLTLGGYEFPGLIRRWKSADMCIRKQSIEIEAHERQYIQLSSIAPVLKIPPSRVSRGWERMNVKPKKYARSQGDSGSAKDKRRSPTYLRGRNPEELRSAGKTLERDGKLYIVLEDFYLMIGDIAKRRPYLECFDKIHLEHSKAMTRTNKPVHGSRRKQNAPAA